ncbi:uncharacterized protein LOC123561863 [Mercenaria mercenaria]|uniref:uncharacterized protein LOC123561863 n=1 Tax=Mercenaria mercenaria TaxID=6596 RepID=UPI00234EF4BD|nr:uncharacterized protein LOC123561863 [Mercenaria mercenaria]
MNSVFFIGSVLLLGTCVNTRKNSGFGPGPEPGSGSGLGPVPPDNEDGGKLPNKGWQSPLMTGSPGGRPSPIPAEKPWLPPIEKTSPQSVEKPSPQHGKRPPPTPGAKPPPPPVEKPSYPPGKRPSVPPSLGEKPTNERGPPNGDKSVNHTKGPSKGCIPINGVCGRNCTLKDGQCVGRSCCSSIMENDGAGWFCRQVGSCGKKCTDGSGECIKDRCCFRKQPRHKGPDDDNNDDSDDRQGGDGNDFYDDDSADSKDDNSREGEKYRDYNGMRVRCTGAKCSARSCKQRGGYCLTGKCCYEKTEHEAQSLCEKKRRLLAVKEKLTHVSSKNKIVRLNCTSAGSFLSRCQGNSCHCLNASSGEEIGQVKRAASFDKSTCDEEQNKTTARLLNLDTLVSNRSKNTFSEDELEEIKDQLEHEIERKFPVDAEARIYEGSTRADIQIKMCSFDCAATAETSDLYSICTEMVGEIEKGNIVLEVNGQQLIPSEAKITNITTTAMLEALGKEMENGYKETEDNKSTVIIAAVVVTVVVLLMSVGVACYCYSKNNKLKKKEAYLNNLPAKENPTYIKA